MSNHWADAITDVVGRTPESDAAVDTDEERYLRERGRRHGLQAIITAVSADHLGDRRDIILANLRRELEAHGHWPQPQPWLDAVAEEMEAGRHYQCGTESPPAD